MVWPCVQQKVYSPVGGSPSNKLLTTAFEASLEPVTVTRRLSVDSRIAGIAMEHRNSTEPIGVWPPNQQKTIAGLVNEGRFSYSYIATGIYAEIRNLSNLHIQTQEEEITRIKNRIARWFSIYFPEIKDVYRNPDAVSGLMIIKQVPLPCDIKELGVEGVNKIWRDARLKGVGIKRVTII